MNMTEHFFIVLFAKLFIGLAVITLCEINQARPYYFKREIILGCLVIALCPLFMNVVMYLVAAYLLRLYPYGIVRAFMWPIELVRSIVKSLTKRYPTR